MMLVYPNFLRIVITSCNMDEMDTELTDNHWYIHDLPRLSVRCQQTKAKPDFESSLMNHLQVLGTPQKFLDSIDGMYDYSSVKVQLVTSVPGDHEGATAERYGILRLRKTIRSLQLDLAMRSKKELRFEICASDIAKISVKWLNEFLDCAMGRTIVEVLSGTDCDASAELKIFYPTEQDALRADGEVQLKAGQICCELEPWHSTPTAIKLRFHHYHSKDHGRMFNQRFMIAYNPKDVGALPLYVYVGSAGLSPEA